MKSIDGALHPLVRKALRALAPYRRSQFSANDMDDGLLRTPSRGFLAIAVAPEQVDRAGRILDAVVRAIEGPDVGGTFSIEPRPPAPFHVDGEAFRIRLKQEATRSDHRPTPAERREIERHPHTHTVPKWEWRATTRMKLEIYSADSSYAPIVKLADGKRATLEAKLADLPGIVRSAVAERKAHRAQVQLQAKQWEEQRLHREREEARREEERRRAAALLKEAQQWRDASVLREYIQAVESALHSSVNVADASASAWLSWARSVADALDPVREIAERVRRAAPAPSEANTEERR